MIYSNKWYGIYLAIENPGSKSINNVTKMATLSKMIILWWLFTLSQFSFDFIVRNIMMKQKGKGYQGIGAIDEAFE